MDDIEPRGDYVIPLFYMRAVKNNFRSKAEGRPIYEDREYVQKLIPGNKTEIPDGPVKQADIDRWPEQYRKFKSRQEQSTEGTPLEVWPVMTPSRVSALKDVNIFTVDQLAEMPDSAAHTVGPDFQTLKKQAAQFLNGADAGAQQQEIEKLKARVDELEQENAELRNNQKKRPGPKPKHEEEADEPSQDSDEELL